jgi:hypothetical protein
MRWCALAAMGIPGCATDSAHIQITERPSTFETRRYQETFDEAYYDLGPSGNLRLVLRKRQPASLEGDELTQTIVVESVWRSLPGVTVADRSQINGTVTYGLAGQRIVQNLTGAGSVFFYENDAGNRATGTLAHVMLESKSADLGDGFLQRIELCGDFSASRNPHQALHIANEIKREQQSAAANRPNQD